MILLTLLAALTSLLPQPCLSSPDFTPFSHLDPPLLHRRDDPVPTCVFYNIYTDTDTTDPYSRFYVLMLPGFEEMCEDGSLREAIATTCKADGLELRTYFPPDINQWDCSDGILLFGSKEVLQTSNCVLATLDCIAKEKGDLEAPAVCKDFSPKREED